MCSPSEVFCLLESIYIFTKFMNIIAASCSQAPITAQVCLRVRVSAYVYASPTCTLTRFTLTEWGGPPQCVLEQKKRPSVCWGGTGLHGDWWGSFSGLSTYLHSTERGHPPPPPPLRKLRGNISHFIVLVISCENVFECVWRMRKDSWSTHSHWCKELQVLYNFQSYSMQINTTLIWWENPLF